MPKKESAIAQRKAAAEELVKKYYNKNYSKLADCKPHEQYRHRVNALARQSLKAAGINFSDEVIKAFVADFSKRANAAAEKAKDDYLYSLSSKAKEPRYGVAAVMDFQRKQVAAVRKAEEAKRKAEEEAIQAQIDEAQEDDLSDDLDDILAADSDIIEEDSDA